MEASQSLSRIAHLASTISQSVAKLQDAIEKQGLPSPSFDEDSRLVIPDDMSACQDAILDSTAELHDLLLEPMVMIREHGGHNNSICLQAIARFGIAGLIPPQGRLSFAEIASQTGCSEDMISRLLRHAMTMHVFHESENGVVAHTAASRLLVNPLMRDWLTVGTEELWPAAVKMVEALEKWPSSSEPNETGFSLANNTNGSIYEVLRDDQDRAGRFGNAMRVFARSAALDPTHIINSYNWSALGQAQVIDIGGGQGHIAIEIAKHFKNLRVVVQDMDQMIQNAEAGVPDNLRERVRFMAHDLFSPQSIQADVIFFRWIFHNWSDKHCIHILRAQIPALTAKSRIIIQDGCLPEPGTGARWREKYLRSDDLSMASMFNSKERTVKEWATLLAEADPRFKVNQVVQPVGSALATIEILWSGDINQ